MCWLFQPRNGILIGLDRLTDTVHGISRDLLCFAMKNLADLDIVGHVHDEIILEAPSELMAEEVSAWMSKTLA